MKRQISMLLVAAVVCVGAWASSPAAAQADEPACIFLHRIYFDSPGADTGSNASRNAEWVQLKSRCSYGHSLKGWKIRDASGHTYTFGTYTLKAGKSVKIHTGSGTNTATDRYWRSRYYIWNNRGDTAKLIIPAGPTVVDTCKYSGAGSSTYC
jgi:hypothetical protein